jgi:hypothetical protein
MAESRRRAGRAWPALRRSPGSFRERPAFRPVDDLSFRDRHIQPARLGLSRDLDDQTRLKGVADVAFNKLIAAAASVALLTAPTVAVAQRAAPVPVTQEVAPADETVDGSALRGGFVIPLIALIAIILGLCAAGVLCGSDDDQLPTSP